MTKHSRNSRSADSARGGIDKTMAKEIRDPWDTPPPATWPSVWAVMRVYGDGSWGMMCASTDKAYCQQQIEFQVNNTGNGRRLFRIVEYRQRISDTPSQSSEARPGVEGAHEGAAADKKGESREPEKLNNGQKSGEIGTVFGFDCEETSGCASTGEMPAGAKSIENWALAESSLSSPPPICKCGHSPHTDRCTAEVHTITTSLKVQCECAASPELLPTQLPKEK